MPRRRWRRRLLLLGAGLFALVVIGGAVLWILKPWLPPIEITAPGPTGERVKERGVFANYFPADRDERGPAILMLGGSEGGISKPLTDVAVALQAEGYTVLTPAYFGAPGTPRNLELVPLETFDRALEWLIARPEVDRDRVGIAGVSKGAEAALLMATRHPELRAVVAGVPSSVVWPGINWNKLRAASSWTLKGRPLPVLPYGPFRLSVLRGDIGRFYRDGLKKLTEHPDAVIRVEKIKPPILLVCGEEDTLWPSCAMARQVVKRADEAGGPKVSLLAYENAGHLAVGPPVDRDDELYDLLPRLGGSITGNNAARADGWPRILAFARRYLGV